MAVPTIAATGTPASGTDDITVSVPDHAVNDITLIFAFNRNSDVTGGALSWSSTEPIQDVPPDYGFTTIRHLNHPSFQLNMAVWAKRETGTAGYTMNLSQEEGVLADLIMAKAVCVRGVATDVPITSAELFRDEDTGTSANPTPVSGISVNCDARDTLVLLYGAVVDDLAFAAITGASGGTYTLHDQSASPSGSDGGWGLWSAPMAGGGTISGGNAARTGGTIGYGFIAIAMPAIVAGVGVTVNVPVVDVTTGVREVTVQSATGAYIDIPLFTLDTTPRFSEYGPVNMGVPMALYLERFHTDQIQERERYRMPLG